ncbi:formyl transferase [Ktedonobacter sp. SOSP1-52]|uniref:methionyl-tRNA formyltransferase n=1 Tax=Ktedonobacter sp. SOSP1-52 TaxID=2778366 RepID=UPI001915079B|nr:formyltransferase family protein [Ktedonobacter sp. SOSP1-52]GHO71783.1 formyl transferase [Ktedonobacter sp. SOSP1-52]
MSNSFEQGTAPRVLFFGMQGTFSALALNALLEAGIDVRAVVLPINAVPGRAVPAITRYENSLPVRTMLPLAHTSLHTNIVQIATKRHLPLWQMSRLNDPTTHAILADYEPDLACVACFSRLIPTRILDLPRLGCLNVHPSLLPANRGPEPLFWTFREHKHETGVTIHLMDKGLDSGPIVLQERIAVPDGMSYGELETRCAERGGVLLAQAAWQLYREEAQITEQDEARSSYHSFPAYEDLAIPVDQWDAREVYNFIRGVGHWESPLHIEAPDSEMDILEVRNCYEYSLEPLEDTRRIIHEGDSFIVRCKQGWVSV